MTTRGGQGGGRVPDGIPRPASIPFAQGANRSDMSQLPGTPGTTLPGPQSGVPQGQAGPIRRALANIPLDKYKAGGGNLRDNTARSGEPIQAGLQGGAGAGPEGMLPSPNVMSDRVAAKETTNFYPILAKIASLPNATTQTKILAQRLRANMQVQPEQMPLTPIERRDREGGIPGPA